MAGLQKTKLLAVLILGVLSTQVENTILAQAPQDSTAAREDVDELRNKYRSRNIAEHIVSLPGTIVSLPLVLFLKASEKAVGYIYENKLVPKTVDLFTSADGRRGLTPKYSNRSGAGVKFFQEGILSPQSELSITITGTTKGRQRYRLRFRDLELIRGFISSTLLVHYRFLPGEAFYGIGPDSRKADRSSYDHEWLNAEANFALLLSKKLTVDFLLGFERNNIFEGSDEHRPSTTDQYTKETLPGLETGPQFGKLQLGLRYDSRNRPGNPTGGCEMSLAGAVFPEIGSDQFDFWKVKADFRRYIHLFHNRVIALRLAAEMTEPFAGRDIPFYYLSSLGVHETIRGFNRGRFLDLDMILGSLEYRIPIWRSLDVSLFADAGQVSSNILSDVSIDEFKLGYGMGFRLYSSEGLVANLEFAASRERFRVYFHLN